MKVDLPDPFWPTSACVRPAPSTTLNRSRATWPGNVFERSETSNNFDILHAPMRYCSPGWQNTNQSITCRPNDELTFLRGNHMRSAQRIFVIPMALGLLLAACGSDDSSSDTTRGQ